MDKKPCQRLREMRESLRLSQQESANLAGYKNANASSWDYYENEDNFPGALPRKFVERILQPFEERGILRRDILALSLDEGAKIDDASNNVLLRQSLRLPIPAGINTDIFMQVARGVRTWFEGSPDTKENRENELKAILFMYPRALDQYQRGESISFDKDAELAVFKALLVTESI